MDDLISRQAAINETWREPRYTDPLNVLTEVRERIRSLPSAQQEQRWIPCSERLPDMYRTYYLVSLADKKEVDIAYFTEYGTWETFRNDEVETWMPLPEPYKGE